MLPAAELLISPFVTVGKLQDKDGREENNVFTQWRSEGKGKQVSVLSTLKVNLQEVPSGYSGMSVGLFLQ